MRIHPVTLQFDDEVMERELRSETLGASYCVMALFFILDIFCRALFPLSNIMFDSASDKSAAIAYTCIAITYTTVLFNLRRVHTLPGQEAAVFTDWVWMTSWVTNVAMLWAMLACGLARRLTAAEGTGAAVCCAMWAFVMVIQHMLHIGFRSRIIVMLMATSIAFTSVAWRKELLAGLVFGEVHACPPPHVSFELHIVSRSLSRLLSRFFLATSSFRRSDTRWSTWCDRPTCSEKSASSG